MSQTVVSSSNIATNQGLSANDEVASDSLAQMLQGVVSLFPSSIPDPLSESQRPDARVNEIILEKLYKWGHTADTIPHKKALNTGYCIATTAYQHTSAEMQAAIALFTYALTVIDDHTVDTGAMKEFVPRLCSGSAQLHPFLDRLVERCNVVMEQLPVFGSNATLSSTIDFINTELYMREVKTSSPENLHQPSVPWLKYMRIQTGLSVGYSTIVWPKIDFPETNEYIQAIPETAEIVYVANDIFSYYKEMKRGETPTFVIDLATAKNTTELQEVRDLVNRLHVLVANIRGILGTGKARDAWEGFVAGYIRFHLLDPRYELAEILPDLKYRIINYERIALNDSDEDM